MNKLHTLLATLSLAACGSGAPMTASTVASLDTGHMIPLAEAIAIATATLPGGFVASAKLDLEDAGRVDPENEPLSYEVAIFMSDTGQLWHVGVNVDTRYAPVDRMLSRYPAGKGCLPLSADA